MRPLLAVENANGFAITFTYDAQGHLTQVADSAKRQFQVRCDAQGRILTIVTAHPTEPRQRVTLVIYAYNNRGELVSVADALGQAAACPSAQRAGLTSPQTVDVGSSQTVNISASVVNQS